MPKTIVQKVVFKNTTPAALYEMYVNPEKHAALTGGKAKISAKEGERYSVYNGFITGKNLRMVKNKLIVQSWRGSDWKKADLDSTFIIALNQKGRDVELEATHANIPDDQVKGIEKGWYDFYWNPWKKFLAGKPVKKLSSM